MPVHKSKNSWLRAFALAVGVHPIGIRARDRTASLLDPRRSHTPRRVSCPRRACLKGSQRRRWCRPARSHHPPCSCADVQAVSGSNGSVLLADAVEAGVAVVDLNTVERDGAGWMGRQVEKTATVAASAASVASWVASAAAGRRRPGWRRWQRRTLEAIIVAVAGPGPEGELFVASVGSIDCEHWQQAAWFTPSRHKGSLETVHGADGSLVAGAQSEVGVLAWR